MLEHPRINLASHTVLKQGKGTWLSMMSQVASSLLSLTPPPPLLLPLPRCPSNLTTKFPPFIIFPSGNNKTYLKTSSSTAKALCAINFSQDALLQDVGAAAAVSVGAYSLIRLFDYLTMRNVIKQSLSRKLVHILSGLLFLCSWPIFSTSTEARYFAAFVPLLNCLRLVIYGLSLATDESLVKSVTREGNPKELLRGPLYYVLILITSAVLFWRESPIGVISLAMMCGGDGFADIMGRRFGTVKIPYNQQKSWAGSISMFLSGFLTSIGMLYYFSAVGYFQLDWSWTLERVALVALLATMVESLPITEIDIAHVRDLINASIEEGWNVDNVILLARQNKKRDLLNEMSTPVTLEKEEEEHDIGPTVDSGGGSERRSMNKDSMFGGDKHSVLIL